MVVEGGGDVLGKVVDESQRPHQEQINGVSVDARCPIHPRRGRVAEQITEVCSVPWRACRQSDVFGKQQPIAPKTHNLAQQVSFRIDADIGGEHLAEVALQVLTAHRAESVDSVGVQPTHKGTERPKR